MPTAKEPQSLRGSAPPPLGGASAPHEPFDLWDFLQVTCTSGRRGVYRLEHEAVCGHLFFDRGALVHADCGELVGDKAAVALLVHRAARCARVDKPWPPCATVFCSFSGLLLQAVGEIEGASRAAREPRDSSVRPVLKAETEERVVAERPPDEQSHARLRYSEFSQLVWFDAAGSVLQAYGDDEQFAGNAAYAVRVAEMLGQLLSLGEFLAMDCRDRDGDRIAYRDGQGGVVACVPATADVAANLRMRLGM